MNIFDRYTYDVLKAFNTASVEFIIVGGYAVNFHGFRRTTGDIDLWLKPNNDNKVKIISAFRVLKIKETILQQLSEMDFTKHLVFRDGEPPFKIDFMTYVSGVKFDEAYKERVITELDGLSLPFIHINHLVLSKINTGRPQDTIDIEQLQKIQQLKNKK
jgi:predicted nucleotidyltransferase